uniref:Uncharacterized protein n=1 Tax=Desertifilum tharense IPPAS B-1220 TaxID=1781255 RepID=A0ACD5GXJ0_9CYAN
MLVNAARLLPADQQPVPENQLRNYFKERTRRVPYKEVATGANPLIVNGTDYRTSPITNAGQAQAFLQTATGPARPPRTWMYPVDPANNNTFAGFANLQLNLIRPRATQPAQREGKEWRVGDRVFIGNNLPEFVYNETAQSFLRNDSQLLLAPSENRWHNRGSGMSDETRSRTSRVRTLDDLGDTGRDGYWERQAARDQIRLTDLFGGVRIVTGTGIYLPGNNDLSAPAAPFPPVAPALVPKRFTI